MNDVKIIHIYKMTLENVYLTIKDRCFDLLLDWPLRSCAHQRQRLVDSNQCK
jgi:hypothetical protein